MKTRKMLFRLYAIIMSILMVVSISAGNVLATDGLDDPTGEDPAVEQETSNDRAITPLPEDMSIVFEDKTEVYIRAGDYASDPNLICPVYFYDGNPHAPTVKVYYKQGTESEQLLVEGFDYELRYSYYTQVGGQTLSGFEDCVGKANYDYSPFYEVSVDELDGSIYKDALDQITTYDSTTGIEYRRLFFIEKTYEYSVSFCKNDGSEPEETVYVPRILWGTVIDESKIPVFENGEYVFGGWYTDPECTKEFDIKTLIKQNYHLYAKWDEKPSYAVTTGDNGTWTRGSTDAYKIVVKRSADDNLTFENFESITVDFRELTLDTDYTKSEGSLVVDLKPEYLETLSNGSHTVNVKFADGTAETTITIQNRTAPNTGDNSNIMLYSLTALMSTAALLFLVKKTKESE